MIFERERVVTCRTRDASLSIPDIEQMIYARLTKEHPVPEGYKRTVTFDWSTNSVDIRVTDERSE